MVVPILLVFLALFVPLAILRRFSFYQKLLVVIVITAHLAFMFLQHSRLVYTTGLPIVVDVHVDAQGYYDASSQFKDFPPFGVTKKAAMDAAKGSAHFGYYYVLGTLWTITPRPVLAMRFLKIMLFFTSLSCIVRVWRTDYGDRLAMWGFAFLGVIFTPIVYYNYRNLKDSLILSLFMFVMALLDTILRPRQGQLHRMSTGKSIFAWCTVLVLLYVISTLRTYTSAIVVIALIMHAIMASRLGTKGRILSLAAMGLIMLFALKIGFVANMMELSKVKFTGTTILGILTLRGMLQAFLSPLPWGGIRQMEPLSTPFYWLYWLLLPYAFYCMLRHFRSNINWHLFVYIMILYVVGAAVGDPPRKRFIVFPILVGWVLAHLAYKRGIHSSQTQPRSETEGQEYCDEDYCEYYELVEYSG